MARDRVPVVTLAICLFVSANFALAASFSFSAESVPASARRERFLQLRDFAPQRSLRLAVIPARCLSLPERILRLRQLVPHFVLGALWFFPASSCACSSRVFVSCNWAATVSFSFCAAVSLLPRFLQLALADASTWSCNFLVASLIAASFGGGGLARRALAARSCDGAQPGRTFDVRLDRYAISPGRGGAAVPGTCAARSALDLSGSRALPCTRKMLSPILRLRYSTIAGCQSAVRLAQFLEQTSGEPELGQRGLELIFVLEFLALLRGHVGFEKDLARIVRSAPQAAARRERPKKPAKQNQTDFLHRDDRRR